MINFCITVLYVPMDHDLPLKLNIKKSSQSLHTILKKRDVSHRTDSAIMGICILIINGVIIIILLTKTTAAQSDDALSYYSVRGL